ncbi:MAG: Rieske 2Fe-2S domain-containing protein [Kiritimatiellae bacterium]|nr:Rieske 2Fe-2S domain-containing protein [Kiritimatiellia bacterium]
MKDSQQDMPTSGECSRRAFSQRMLFFGIGTTLSSLFAPLTRAEEDFPKITIPASKMPSQLKTEKGGVMLKIKGKKVLLIRTGPKTMSALVPECTHKKCQVLYKREWGEIWCKCHGSKYDIYGNVIKPPAPKNLPQCPITFTDEKIVLELRPAPDI